MSPTPPTGAASERRNQSRRILRVQAQLHIAGHPPMAVRTMDVSEGGISVLCAVNLPVRTECTIHVQLPIPPNGRRLLQLRAVVQYGILSSSGGGFQLGMATIHTDAPARDAIRIYIKN